MENTKEQSKTKGLSLGAKLVLIISTLVFISLVSITFLVQFFMSDTTSADAEITTLEKTNNAASTTEKQISSIRANTSLMLELLSISGSSQVLSRQTTSFFFERNPDIAAVIVPEEQELINTRFFISNEIESELINTFLTAHESEIQRAIEGETFILNAAPVFELQVLAYLFPWREGGKDQAVVIFFSSDSLSETFGSSTTSVTYLINGDADLLIHPDIDLVMAGTNVSKEKIIEIMNSNGNELHQQLYEEDDGTRYFGAYKKLSFGNLAVVTNIERDTALKSVNSLTWQNIYLTLAVIFISILFVALYSKTISKPIQALTAVAQEINQGNFNTELFEELKSKRTDEIGVLIQSTKDEREILNTVSRLTNKGVAKAIVRKEIDFEPHLKDITIFFSDIRGFTAISDGFNKRFGEKSAAEIISFLNDYMSRMVNCITISGGNVDKFEGDAIMACWGVLRDENLDTPEHKKHVQEDAINAVRGVLAMRYALMVYNKAAEAFTKEHEGEPLAKYKPHIRIGSGLNSGRATVGFMGSYDKMEFTSIGDAVNLASRTESSNKPCGTDMLITEDTYNLLKYDYIKSPENNYTIKPENLDKEIIVEVIPVTFEVKGKGKQHFYGVVNMPRFDIEGFFKTTDPDFVADPDCICAIGPKGPRTLAEVRTLLGIPTPDFSGVNLDAEESKVKAN
jgi:adenylate cyclase